MFHDLSSHKHPNKYELNLVSLELVIGQLKIF